jgi:Right handed beta helix region
MINSVFGRRFAVIVGAMAVIAIAFGSGLFVAHLGQAPRTAAVVSPPAKASPAAPSPVTAPPGPILGSVAGCPSGQLVTDAPSLEAALASATPGSVIVMGTGTYSGRFEAAVAGTSQAPVTLCGTRDAIIDGGDIKTGYALHLNGSSWWHVAGFTVTGAQKGVVADHVQHAVISGLYVHDVGDEGIHLREFSSDNVVDSNKIRNTGLLKSKFGEGIYIGTANSNWCTYTSCAPDNSDRNVISNNDIANTTAENIDVKEGTTSGAISNNQLSGDGMVASAASAWINVKGNGWTVTGNTGQHSPKDGFQVHKVYEGWGQGNVFRANHAGVFGPGYGFYVQSRSLGTIVTCDNTAVGAALGLSNMGCQ